MDGLKTQLLALLLSEPDKAIAEMKVKSKDISKIKNYIKEYKDLDRNQRDGQIDRIQTDKAITDGALSKMVKIYINHAQNIVQTLSAFIVGRPPTITPSVDNNLSAIIKQFWRSNRIDAKVLKATIIKLSETQVAMNFYIKDVTEASIFGKILMKLKVKSQAKEIKVKILDNTQGLMTPVFDGSGDMVLFMWEYDTIVATKTVKNVQVYDDVLVYTLDDTSGKMAVVSRIPHGFDRIPIAYDAQDEPQWYTVKSPADRHEVALSKLGDSNDYSGHPILITEGVVNNMPLKSESGKHFNLPITIDENGKEIKGNVRFLEAKTAPESNKLELDKLEDVIAYGSGVPNLSLEKLKSLGNVAEKTVKLMFLGTELKAELKRSETRTFIERCLNIILGGIITTTNTNLKNESGELYYDIQFNSILPSDIAEKVEYVTKAVEARIMSRTTGIEILDLVEDVVDEMALIDAEVPLENTNPSTVIPAANPAV